MKRLELVIALVAALAALFVTGASAADFQSDSGPCTETPGNGALLRCTTGYVGQQYELQIETEDGSGCTPYVWFEIKNGSLPAGLSMTREGVVSGTPTGGPGLSRFWVWVHDQTAAQGGPAWCTFDDQSERELSIPVDAGLGIDNQSVKPGTLNQPYADSFTASQVLTVNQKGPAVQATWSLQSGTLPPGVTLSASGALTGTPTAEGSFQFVVRAQNGGISDAETYTLSVRQPLVVTSPFVPLRASAEVGVDVAKSATATGGSGTYTWSLSAGTLPAGVVLDPAKGTISGTPQAAGTFPFALTATDSEGRVATTNTALKVAPRLAIKTLRLKPAKRGRVYRAKLRTGGGVLPLKWKATGKLPHGVALAKNLGVLVGKPKQTGTFHVTVEARDALGVKAKQPLELVVKP